MKNKLISILMPAYKSASFIEETLKSIKNQSYSNWELIVVEDGIDDGTKVIVDKFKISVNQNVFYYRNDINKGVSATRNVAANMAKGIWYALLDSDDIWHKDHLQTLMATALENPKGKFIYSTHIKFYDKIEKTHLETSIDGKLKTPPFLSKNLPTALFNGYMIQPSAVMLSSELFDIVGGFDESLRYVEDLNFFFKILKKGYKFIYTRKSTSYYKQNPNGLTANNIQICFATAKVREEVLGWNWKEIDKKVMIKKTSEAWLSTARLSRKSDRELAKYAIKKTLKYKFNLQTLFFLILIYVKQ